MRIIAVILLVLSVYLSLKHGWDAFHPLTTQQIETMNHLGVQQSVMPYFGVLSIFIGLMLCIPQTFFLANVLNAMIYILIMVLLLKAGDYGLALLETIFIAISLIMIKLKYPFKRHNF